MQVGQRLDRAETKSAVNATEYWNSVNAAPGHSNHSSKAAYPVQNCLYGCVPSDQADPRSGAGAGVKIFFET